MAMDLSVIASGTIAAVARRERRRDMMRCYMAIALDDMKDCGVDEPVVTVHVIDVSGKDYER